MKTVLLMALAVLTLALPAHAEGYLSHYSGGGSAYTSGGGLSSRYGSGGGYYGGSGGSGWSYGGPSTPIERKHGATWRQYQNKLHQPQSTFFNIPLQNTWATRQYVAWTGHYPGGYSSYPCGNYQRAPTGCRISTTRYVPAIER